MRKDEIQTYPEMILSEGNSEDELSTQGNTEKALNLHFFRFLCQNLA